MPQTKGVPLASGAYNAKSIIANAQRCVNLYPEINPEETQPVVPVTHYPTQGLRWVSQHLRDDIFETAPAGNWRCIYRASNGKLYGVILRTFYEIAPDFSWFKGRGALVDTGRNNPISMADNGVNIVIVDGSTNGYTYNLQTDTFAQITDPNFTGADVVVYLDTFFVFNRIGFPQFYISESGSVSFDALDFANKTGSPDKIQWIITLRRELYLLGELTSEVWANSGAADFPFAALNGAYIDHGVAAKYSVAQADTAIYFLAQDRQGGRFVMVISQYQGIKISTFAMDAAFTEYERVDDAVGWTQESEGHLFYWLSFPTANKTWCYDLATKQWHERTFTGEQGEENRHRANNHAYAYGLNVVSDWQNCNLYVLDPTIYQDQAGYGNGWANDDFSETPAPIVRRRGFPHAMSFGTRVTYQMFIADMEVGTEAGTVAGLEPQLSLRWSDDRGKTFGSPIRQGLGSAGEYFTSVQFQRLGMARDRVFELFWSMNAKTALNGAFVSFTKLGS
jgi:hypothetical protein